MILLRIAGCAEDRTVDSKMLAEVESCSSHRIEDTFRISSTATKCDNSKTVLTTRVKFRSIDAMANLSSCRPLRTAVSRPTEITDRQLDRNACHFRWHSGPDEIRVGD